MLFRPNSLKVFVYHFHTSILHCSKYTKKAAACLNNVTRTYLSTQRWRERESGMGYGLVRLAAVSKHSHFNVNAKAKYTKKREKRRNKI